jgi:hypothetical protein
MNQYSKDPNATLDYKVDWAAWLGTDTIFTSTFTVPTGITKSSETNNPTDATVWLSGGTAGQSYQIINRITTVGGRTDDRTFLIVVEDH